MPDVNTAFVRAKVQFPDDNARTVPFKDVLVPRDNMTSVSVVVQFSVVWYVK